MFCVVKTQLLAIVDVRVGAQVEEEERIGYKGDKYLGSATGQSIE